MDDATLASLEAALTASPENVTLLGVVLKELESRRAFTDGMRVLGTRSADAIGDAATRLLAARICLGAERFERALELVRASSDPQALVVRARAELALGRSDEARKLYERAIAENPAVEDVELAAKLAARMPAVDAAPQDGRA